MRSRQDDKPRPELRQLDAWNIREDVGVIRRPLEGLLVSGPREHPFDHAIAHPCPDPDCPYRLASIRAFANMRELVTAHIVRPAKECGMPVTRYFRGVDVELWKLRSPEPLRIAELSYASIASQVPLSAPDLDMANLDSASCEVVRTVCDYLHVEAIHLPAPSDELGESFLLCHAAWKRVDLERLGSLHDALPLLGPGGAE